MLIQQILVEHLLEASHWGISGKCDWQVLPLWNFHASADSDDSRGNMYVLSQLLWNTDLCTHVNPVSYYQDQIPTHFSVLLSHDKHRCPPTPRNIFLDFFIFMSVSTQFPLTKYATVYVCLLKALGFLHHPFQIPPLPEAFLVLPLRISYFFLHAPGLGFRLLELPHPEYLIWLFVYTGYQPNFSTRLSAACFPPLLLASLACVKSTSLE